ncbi:MAG: hypothetical protein ACC628_22995 [Pirellulaceae bacterium]
MPRPGRIFVEGDGRFDAPGLVLCGVWELSGVVSLEPNRARYHNLTTPTAQTHPPTRSDRAEGVSESPKTSSFARRPARAVCDRSVRVVTRSFTKAGMGLRRILVHITRIDPGDAEASGGFLGSPRPKTTIPGESSHRFAGNCWWTRARRIRTIGAMPLEVPILEIKPAPVYQRIAPKAKHLQELGLSQSQIGCWLGVDRRTVGKALRWLSEVARS